MAYIYRHIRLDKNIPFYVGIGSDNEGKYSRAYDTNFKSRRNKHWKAITNKTPYEVEIMLDDLTWEEACEKEKEFIKLYGRVNDGGTLCNYTLGGEGTFGYKHTPKTKAAITESSTGRLHKEEAKLRISKARIGMNFTKQHINNLSKSHKGIGRSLESRIKQSLKTKSYDVVLNLYTGIYYDTAVEAGIAYGIPSSIISLHKSDEFLVLL